MLSGPVARWLPGAIPTRSGRGSHIDEEVKPVSTADERTDRWHRHWDMQSSFYDKYMQFFERHIFGDSRSWACGQASGETLEVAVGTGLNFGSYPRDVDLTGIDLADQMLEVARTRAAELGRAVTLVQGDAHRLPYDDASFDTVVCTFGLCAIPDHVAAIEQMIRVLRPGGRLILVDHVQSSAAPLRGVQRALETVTVPLGGEHFLRRPLTIIEHSDLEIERVERFKAGLVERLVATKPALA